jgi:hypothetical protein
MKTETSKAGDSRADQRLVKVVGDSLTSTCANGDQHNYTVAQEAKITCDGKEGKLADLKEGATIRVTLSKDDKNKILAVECGKHIPAIANA